MEARRGNNEAVRGHYGGPKGQYLSSYGRLLRLIWCSIEVRRANIGGLMVAARGNTEAQRVDTIYNELPIAVPMLPLLVKPLLMS